MTRINYAFGGTYSVFERSGLRFASRKRVKTKSLSMDKAAAKIKYGAIKSGLCAIGHAEPR
jgi:hypothetical protein